MRHALLAFALLLPALALAQPDAALFAAPAQTAEQIAPLFGALQAKLREARVVRGHFTQRKWLRELPKPLVSGGDFVIARDLGILWSTRTPFATDLVINSAGLVQRENGRETMRLTSSQQPGLAAFASGFYQFFTLDLSTLAERFELHGAKAADGWTLGLKPRAAAMAKSLEAVTIAGSDRVNQVTLFEGGGDRTEIELTDVTLSASASEADRKTFAP
jgi:hypothetical protein